MDRSYWQQQTKQAPLFPELEWSRPENRHQAGKLLIVGGNAHGFAAPAEAYALAVKAGAGTVRAVLPDAIRKIVGIIIEHADFAPSTPSGSFSQRALAELLDHALWADGMLLAGDFGRNSETAIVIEKLLQKTNLAVTITKDAVDYICATPHTVAQRENTTLVLSLAQLQRLATGVRFHTPITFKMDLIQLVDWLHEFTTQFAPHIIVRHLDTTFVAVKGQVCTTRITHTSRIWRLKTATTVSVWWMQNPSKPYAALSTAITQS